MGGDDIGCGFYELYGCMFQGSAKQNYILLQIWSSSILDVETRKGWVEKSTLFM